MENVEGSASATSNFIESITSNPDALKLLSETSKDEVVMKGMNCEILNLPEGSDVEFILCDVRINGSIDDSGTDTINQLTLELNSKNEEISNLLKQAESYSEEVRGLLGQANIDSEEIVNSKKIINQLRSELHSKKEEINNLLKQAGSYKEGMNTLLGQVTIDKEDIENSQKILDEKKNKLLEFEESLKQEQQARVVLETRINERVRMFNSLPGPVRDLLVDSNLKDVKSLQDRLAAKKKKIRELNDLIKQEQEDRETLKAEVNEKTKELFEKLFYNNI